MASEIRVLKIALVFAVLLLLLFVILMSASFSDVEYYQVRTCAIVSRKKYDLYEYDYFQWKEKHWSYKTKKWYSVVTETLYNFCSWSHTNMFSLTNFRWLVYLLVRTDGLSKFSAVTSWPWHVIYALFETNNKFHAWQVSFVTPAQHFTYQ